MLIRKLDQAVVQGALGALGALSGGIGYKAGLSQALRVLAVGGGSAEGAIIFGNIYGSLASGTAQIYGNLPISTDFGGFRP